MSYWNWIFAHPDAIKHYKKVKAVHIRTVNGIEVWRDAYGCCRLMRKFDGRIQISNKDFFGIEEASSEASKC